VTPEQIAKMQAGARAASAAKKVEADRLAGDEHAQWEERHARAYQDLLRSRQ
jgi:hypothetical protein